MTEKLKNVVNQILSLESQLVLAHDETLRDLCKTIKTKFPEILKDVTHIELQLFSYGEDEFYYEVKFKNNKQNIFNSINVEILYPSENNGEVYFVSQFGNYSASAEFLDLIHFIAKNLPTYQECAYIRIYHGARKLHSYSLDSLS